MSASKYQPKFCQMLIDHMASGHTFMSFGGVVGVARRTLYLWVEKYPDFAEAHEIAITASALYWEDKGIEALDTNPKEFNATVYIWLTKNVLGWRDKSEVEHSGNLTLSQLVEQSFKKPENPAEGK